MESSCIRKYAEIRKDPTACELLLPAQSGWSCFGPISSRFYRGVPCLLFDDNDLYCNPTYSEGKTTIKNPQLENCELYERKDIRETCYWERTAEKDNVYECNKITHPIIYNNCEFDYAEKQKNPNLCKAITDKSHQEYCEFYVRMILKYPREL